MITGSGRSGAGTAFHGRVVLCLVLPLLVFAAGAGLSWKYAVTGAREDLQRSALVTAEHATRVLDTQFLVAAEVNDLVGHLDDAAVTADEADLHDRILAIIRRLPQVGGVEIIDADGQTLLATRDFSIRQHASVAGQAYFTAQRDAAAPFSLGVSPSRGLVLAVRRGAADGPFRGVILVTVASDAFEAFDAMLFTGGAPGATGLYLDDGTLLARYPTNAPDPDPAALPEPIARAPATDILQADDGDRLIGYHQLPAYPVYATVARSWGSIAAGWRAQMQIPIVCGIVATIGLVVLSLLALGPARRESAALDRLQDQIRLRETAEATLRQAQRLEAIGRLTGGIAHDFNNHLTVISSSVELLKHRLPGNSEGLHRLADAAMQGVQRAATLTHRLLAFARQQPVEPEPMDVGRLVAGMLDLLRRTLGESIAIETNLASGLWPTRVDGNQLENVLLNLAINARDAMPAGGILTIGTANVQPDGSSAAGQSDGEPGQYVSVSVADSGAGMTADVIAKAFEPFFTTKPQGEGPGLGLSMVYGFVKQSGGHVHIVSEPGQGCVVKLYLPRYMPAPVAAPETQWRDRSASKGVGETILVVEDDEDVRRATVEVLKELGYLVLEAPDAMEAFRLIVDRGGIDLVFTDVGLPGGVNGRALADAVRNISSEIKLLFTTGYAGSMAGADDEVPVLAKPFDLRQLGAVVRDVLDAPSPRQTARIPAAEKA